MEKKFSADQRTLMDLQIIELDDRLEFGAAIVTSDLNADVDTNCSNVVHCTQDNSACGNTYHC